MLYQKQAFRHDPENGVFGDCHRTCIANILDLPRDDVPNWGIHFNDVEKFNSAAAKFLATKGLKELAFAYSCEDMEVLLNTMRMHNPDTYYLLGGKSPRGTNHVVVCFNDKMLWDTAIDGGGIVAPYDEGYYFVYILAPIFPLPNPPCLITI